MEQGGLISVFFGFMLLVIVTAPWLFRGFFPVNSFSANYDKSRGGGNIITWCHEDHDAAVNRGLPRLLKIRVDWLNFMYMVKKHQYLFYKHFLLHGLHVVIVVRSCYNVQTHSSVNGNLNGELGLEVEMASSLAWRVYWLCLNTAYTMEFFLQTLVRRRHLTQGARIFMNASLMLGSSVAALRVLSLVYCGGLSSESGIRLFNVATGWRWLLVPVLSWHLNYQNRGKEFFNIGICVCLACLLSHISVL
eukprot:gnl/MRDRNA2_/MRDRNA2_65907_c0_seq2.p1 gnl/MRDRNA2_/MRDRNA2_65907_c0~~gnl/MRDRNA2_/MRDRNA2_65907_c0_seq2.p1  ORF type:complete len:248 (-),score=10.49 gnl/MRDRNA2_/MRDRNA2_65907_c0_seq2:67-810(-)